MEEYIVILSRSIPHSHKISPPIGHISYVTLYGLYTCVWVRSKLLNSMQLQGRINYCMIIFQSKCRIRKPYL